MAVTHAYRNFTYNWGYDPNRLIQIDVDGLGRTADSISKGFASFMIIVTMRLKNVSSSLRRILVMQVLYWYFQSGRLHF